MNNAASGVSIPMSTFGGLSTELSPSDLPEGASPDNQDVAYLPGGFSTRPALSRLYPNPVESTPIVYEKSFRRLDGQIFNLVLFASGNLYSENITNAPGIQTLIGSVPAGSRCKSVEAYGKLFMAFNDGLRGTDIPRQFDGVKFSRVGQGGPCGAPTFGETIVASSTLGNSGATGSHTITSLVSSDQTTSTIRVWEPA